MRRFSLRENLASLWQNFPVWRGSLKPIEHWMYSLRPSYTLLIVQVICYTLYEPNRVQVNYKENEYKLSAQRFLGSYGWTIVTSDWLGGCLEYHRPIITNACPPRRSQKSLHPKHVLILPWVSEVGNYHHLHLLLSKTVTLVRYLSIFKLANKSCDVSATNTNLWTWDLG